MTRYFADPWYFIARIARGLDEELVDCMSMVAMQARGIVHALTNDPHLRQEGFTVVNDAP
jgi:predicted nucleic acid-binding protein